MARLTPEQAAAMLDEELSAKPLEAPQAPAQAPTLKPRMSPEEAAAFLDHPSTAPDDSISLGNLARDVVGGATFGLDDEIFGGARSLAGGSSDQLIDEERRRKDAYQKKNPWTSFLARGAGAVAGSLLPVGWAARGVGLGARGARAVEAIAPVIPAGRLANATVPQALHAGGMIGAKASLYQNFGDREGSTLDRIAGMAGDPVGTASTTALGYGLGAPFGYLGRGAANVGEDLGTAARIGVGPEANALSRARGMLDDSGRSVEDLFSEAARGGPNYIPVGGRRAILEGYSAARNAGADDVAARVAALQAYLATNPTYQGRPILMSTADSHVGDILTTTRRDFGEIPYRYETGRNSTGAPLLAAERMSGPDRPITGSVKGVTQSLANSPGASRSIISNAVTPRQEGAIGRARSYIDSAVGEPEYTGFVRDLTRASDDAMRIGYQRADAAAREFDITPALQRHAREAQRSGGETHRALTSALDDIAAWQQRTQEAQLSPAEFLQSYRQMRADLTTSIENARNGGLLGQGKNRQVARALTRLKRDMDASAARRNPEWWRVNRGSAEAFRIQEAADMGRKMNLNEGAAMQEARDWFRNASTPEREAFQRGLARQLFDKLPKESTHDLSKGYMAGGVDEAEEGLRGLINMILPERDARQFLERFQRERVALSTYRLDKGSQTSALEAEARKGGIAQQLAATLRYGLNPMSILEDVAKATAGRQAEASDAALARLLTRQTLPEYVDLLQRVERAGVAGEPSAFGQLMSRAAIPEAPAAVAPGAFGITRDLNKYDESVYNPDRDGPALGGY